jgi:hypothetical protein
MASTQKEVLGLKKRGSVDFNSTVKMIGSNSNVMEAYQNMIGSVANNVARSQSQNLNLGQSINNVISQTAAASNSEIIAGKAGRVPPRIK